MKNAFRILSIAALTVGLLAGISSCGDDYDDSEIRDRLDNVEDRVTQLEEWCATVNNDITSLKGLITALENNDYVTGVETLEDGYRITFSQSGSITIHNGKDGSDGEDGKDGLDGSTPIIGVDKYSDGLYYWTIQTEEGKMDWLTDADGNMIRTTGDNGKDGTDGEDGNDGEDGLTPHIGNNGNWWIGTTDTGIKVQGGQGESGLTPHIGDNGNWWVGTTDTGVKAQGNDAIAPKVQINSKNEWEISIDGGKTYTSTGVKATGEKGAKGDAVFAENGIDCESDPDNVIFTLANGATFTLPRTGALTVGFDSYGVFMLTPYSQEVTIVLPETLEKENYTALVAEVKNEAGTDMDIITRASEPWKVTLTGPTFVDGVCQNDAKVTVVASGTADNGDRAILKVTLIDCKGQEISASRVLEYFNGVVVNVQAGELSSALKDITGDITALKVIGTLDESENSSDFKYIREKLTAMKILDLSSTNMKELPDRALCFNTYTKLPNNTKLQKVILPEGLITIGSWAFEGCIALTELNFPSTVTTFGTNILARTNVSSVTIPVGVTTLKGFTNSGLISIYIPETVTSINSYTFESNSSNYKDNGQDERHCLTTVTFADNSRITKIPTGCFTHQKKLTTIKLPNSLKEIEEGAFQYTAIKDISLPNGVKMIDENAFRSAAITEIDLPASITDLHPKAFADCGMVKIICRATNVPATYNKTNWPEKYKNSCVLQVPAESIAEYQTAWSTYFKTIEKIQ